MDSKEREDIPTQPTHNTTNMSSSSTQKLDLTPYNMNPTTKLEKGVNKREHDEDQPPIQTGTSLAIISKEEGESKKMKTIQATQPHTTNTPIFIPVTPRYTGGEGCPWENSSTYNFFKMEWIESPLPRRAIALILDQKEILRIPSNIVNFKKYIPMKIKVSLSQENLQHVQGKQFTINGGVLVENRTTHNSSYTNSKFHFNPDQVLVSKKAPFLEDDKRQQTFKLTSNDFIIDNEKSECFVCVTFFVDCDHEHGKELVWIQRRTVHFRVAVHFQQEGLEEKITLFSPELRLFRDRKNLEWFSQKYPNLPPIHITSMPSTPPIHNTHTQNNNTPAITPLSRHPSLPTFPKKESKITPIASTPDHSTFPLPYECLSPLLSENVFEEEETPSLNTIGPHPTKSNTNSKLKTETKNLFTKLTCDAESETPTLNAMKEFSYLIRDQHQTLMETLEKVIKEKDEEIFGLKAIVLQHSDKAWSEVEILKETLEDSIERANRVTEENKVLQDEIRMLKAENGTLRKTLLRV
eukprot:TRINITY_DN1514_c0_g1_i1.p1 TRINITY_DN1514_c0_g1~~TRINITY_DN1514_c0_g1_i1.p1  ORF type:complete len:523 (-),score=133.08 TRINITY_DN1514_c0_g1_i1:231-1799(-)